MEYLVEWKIEIDADSPEEAARLARAIQLDPQNDADHFTVYDDHDEPIEVNALDNEE